MGVRVDSQGKVGADFHSAGGGKLCGRAYGVAKANGGSPEPVLSWRYFLQDASFLVGLESSEPELILRLHSALREPIWQLYLGRKAHVPGEPPYLKDGIVDGKLEDVFRDYPLSPNVSFPQDGRVRVVIDDINGREQRVDVPIDFSQRRFAPRYVSVFPITLSFDPSG
jgi:CRISPR system Cascade subunit CasD